jgi:hypothetical protein
MPSKPTGKKALFKRSRNMPIKLAHKTCLRCSKRVFDDSTHRCGYKDFQKCGACERKHKKCDSMKIYFVVTTPLLLTIVQIPRKFILKINHLLILARDFAFDEDDYVKRLAELDTAQKRYTKYI